MEKEIAVRLFENKKLGTTYGRGLYRSAVFNASAEIKDPHVKYLLDFYQFERWLLRQIYRLTIKTTNQDCYSVSDQPYSKNLFLFSLSHFD